MFSIIWFCSLSTVQFSKSFPDLFLIGSVSRQLLYITTSSIPCQHFFFKLFSFLFLFFSGDCLADDFAILPPPYPFCQHLFSSSFDFFLSLLLSHSLHSFIFFIFLLVAGVWFSSGCYLAGIWRSSGYNLAPIWFLLSFFHPLHRCTAAFYFGSGYFGTYYLYKKIPLFYKQNLFIAVIYFLEP